MYRLESEGFMDIVSIQGELRYKLGVIDFLTKYNISKAVENKLKSTIRAVNSNEVSAIESASYAQRFSKFMKDNL